jgi:chemotaxis signal transduction protein
LTDTINLLDFEELKSSFDRTFQQARVERNHELVHLLVVRIGTARFALKVCDLAGLARAQTVVPVPAADPGLLGLAGLKGRLVAVYSLAAQIGSAALTTEPQRWLVLSRSDRGIALAFSAAEGTMMVPSSDFSRPSMVRRYTRPTRSAPARRGCGCSTSTPSPLQSSRKPRRRPPSRVAEYGRRKSLPIFQDRSA